MRRLDCKCGRPLEMATVEGSLLDGRTVPLVFYVCVTCNRRYEHEGWTATLPPAEPIQ